MAQPPWPPPPPTMAPGKRRALIALGVTLQGIGAVICVVAILQVRTLGSAAMCALAPIGAFLIGTSILILIAAAARLDIKL